MADFSLPSIKTCTKCGVKKPATDEFFHRDGSGLKGKCRPCRLESSRQQWAEYAGANWRAKHAADPSRRLSVAKAWRDANRDKCAAYGRNKHSKVQANPQARLSRNVSCYVYQSLKGTKAGRKWQSLVGYTTDELRRHLERQFLAGMSWENYGEWHIDHIRPIASFRFSSPEDADFRACWAMSNLRPLWAMENIRKADRVIALI